MTLITSLSALMPNLGAWLMSQLDTINFIHNFAWIFVLSSLIPSLLLGRDRSVTVHFLFCLTFTLVSTWISNFVLGRRWDSSGPLLAVSLLFYNPFFAMLYLLAPYIIMLALDIHTSRVKTRRNEEMIRRIKISSPENSIRGLDLELPIKYILWFVISVSLEAY